MVLSLQPLYWTLDTVLLLSLFSTTNLDMEIIINGVLLNNWSSWFAYFLFCSKGEVFLHFTFLNVSYILNNYVGTFVIAVILSNGSHKIPSSLLRKKPANLHQSKLNFTLIKVMDNIPFVRRFFLGGELHRIFYTNSPLTAFLYQVLLTSRIEQWVFRRSVLL